MRMEVKFMGMGAELMVAERVRVEMSGGKPTVETKSGVMMKAAMVKAVMPASFGKNDTLAFLPIRTLY